MFGYNVKVVKRGELHQFQVLPNDGSLERTFAWPNWSRRLSKDYELLHTSTETIIHISFAPTCSCAHYLYFLERFLGTQARILWVGAAGCTLFGRA